MIFSSMVEDAVGQGPGHVPFNFSPKKRQGKSYKEGPGLSTLALEQSSLLVIDYFYSHPLRNGCQTVRTPLAKTMERKYTITMTLGKVTNRDGWL